MRSLDSRLGLIALSLFSITLCSCSSTSSNYYGENYPASPPPPPVDYLSRIPQHMSVSEKTVVVDPRTHTWGAYGSDGELIRGGVASAGANYCHDLGRGCHTQVGSFRIYSLGSPSCKSHKFPMPRGGAPMPYCMYFKNGQALHGVPANEVGDGNFSHGCVRMLVGDAEWLRYNFANVGTRVIVKSY